jgi:hypothetical protein
VRPKRLVGIRSRAASVANWTRRLLKNPSPATKRASARSRTTLDGFRNNSELYPGDYELLAEPLG